MKYSQIRVALLTFTIGLLSIPFVNFIQAKWIEASIELPKVESKTPIYIFEKYHPEKVKRGGGGGSGGITCDEFIRSLGKLTKKSRAAIANSPCQDLVPKE